MRECRHTSGQHLIETRDSGCEINELPGVKVKISTTRKGCDEIPAPSGRFVTQQFDGTECVRVQVRESPLRRRICVVVGRDAEICSNVMDLFWVVVARFVQNFLSIIDDSFHTCLAALSVATDRECGQEERLSQNRPLGEVATCEHTVLVCALGTGGTFCREGLYSTLSRTSANLRVSKSEEADNEHNSGNFCSKPATVTITTEVEIFRRQLSRRVSRLASVGVLRPRSFVQPCTSEAGLRQEMCASGSSNSPSCPCSERR